MKLCATFTSVLILGGIFIAVGISSIAVGGTFDTFYCNATKSSQCARKANFYMSSAGDIYCEYAIWDGSDCLDIRVTNQVYAFYSVMIAGGAVILSLAVLISLFRILQIAQKITIDTSRTNVIWLILFFICTLLGVMFFLLQFNAASIACSSNCDSRCALQDPFNFGQVDFNSDGTLDCMSCIVDDYGDCVRVDSTYEAITVQQVGLGLGIPFIIIGPIFGIVWIVRAVIQPTRSKATSPTPKA